MLHTGGGTGHTCVAHGDAGDDQTLKNVRDSLGFPVGQTLCVADALLDSFPHHLGDLRAVFLTDQLVGDPPFADGDVLGNHIAQTGLEQVGGSLAQHVQIADDHSGAGGVQGDLQTGACHGAGCGGVAVHGGSGAGDEIGLAGEVGKDLAYVIDDTGANTEDQVAAGVEMHHSGAHSEFIRLQMVLGEYIFRIRNTGVCQNGADLLACGGILVAVGEDENLLATVAAHQLRYALQGAGLDDQLLQRGAVVLTAFALETPCVDQFPDILHNLKHLSIMLLFQNYYNL